MKPMLAGCLLALCGASWAADPVVKDVKFSQDANTRIVTAEYTLENGPAFVTAEFVADGALELKLPPFGVALARLTPAE